jgi:hypothetical protein
MAFAIAMSVTLATRADVVVRQPPRGDARFDVRAQRTRDGLTFLLKGVADFALRNTPGLRDLRIDRVEREGF